MDYRIHTHFIAESSIIICNRLGKIDLFIYHSSLKTWRKLLGSSVQENDLDVSSVRMPHVFAISKFCTSSLVHLHSIPYPTQVCA